jgi:hypothetical protein
MTVIGVTICFLLPLKQPNFTRILLKPRTALNSELCLEGYLKIKASWVHNVMIILSTPGKKILDSF